MPLRLYRIALCIPAPALFAAFWVTVGFGSPAVLLDAGEIGSRVYFLLLAVAAAIWGYTCAMPVSDSGSDGDQAVRRARDVLVYGYGVVGPAIVALCYGVGAYVHLDLTWWTGLENDQQVALTLFGSVVIGFVMLLFAHVTADKVRLRKARRSRGRRSAKASG